MSPKPIGAVLTGCESQELKRLKAELPKEEHAALKGTLWLFRKPWADLDPEEREKLQRLFAHSPALQSGP